MQLRIARLCLDCEEIHDGPACPVCGSESFAYISRWIPTPERRHQQRPKETKQVEAYRRLLTPPLESNAARWIKRGALGLAAVSVARWAWRRRSAGGRGARAAGEPERAAAEEARHPENRQSLPGDSRRR